MLSIYRTDNRIISEIDHVEEGCWIMLTAPTLEETSQIAETCDIDLEDLRAALDDEESSRLSLEDNYSLIIVDIPIQEVRNNRETYTTIPLGIILLENIIITICAQETAVLRTFTQQRVRDFSTKKQIRFMYQILYNACMVYQSLLRSIDSKRFEIEDRIQQSLEDEDLILLHDLESNLVYFATSLRANGLTFDRITRYGRIKKYEEDQDLLEDLLIENKQAIEMTAIYREVIIGTRELLSAVINNQLNNAMKYLAAITIVMSIPDIISGLMGMNLDSRWMPFATVAHGFSIICAIILIICVVAMFVLKKRKML